MRRAHSQKDISVALRRLRQRRQFEKVLISRGLVQEERALNKYRKNRPYDCGVVRCRACHYGKLFYPAKKEVLARLKEKEQLKELELL